MKTRTAAVILTLCAILAAFIWFVERDAMTTAERSARSDSAFASLRVDFVEEVSLSGPEGKVVLKKDRAGRWRIAAPVALDADEVEVKALLSSLDFLLVERRVEGDAAKKAGCDRPRLSGTALSGGKAVRFRIGKEAPDSLIYLCVDNDVFAVSGDFLEAVDRGVNDLRRRRLLDLEADDVEAIALVADGAGTALSKDSRTGWTVNAGPDGAALFADSAGVARLLAAVTRVEASRFVADGATDLSQWGLDEDAARVTLRRKGKAPVELRAGTDCGDGLVHATVAGSGTVVCAGGDFAETIRWQARRFIDRRPARFRAEDVTAIRMTRGSQALTLTSDDNGLWRAGDLARDETDQGQVSALLESFCRVTAVPVDGDAGACPAAAVLSFHLSDGGERQITFCEDGDGLLARRDDEPLLLRADRTLLDGFVPFAPVYRVKLLRRDGDVEQLDMTGPLSQSLVRSDDHWVIRAPVAAPASSPDVKKIVELITATKVERFVPPSEAASFQPLFAAVTATLAQTRTAADGSADRTETARIELQIGAPADGENRYARVKGEDGVFTVGPAYWQRLTAPLADPASLQIAAEGMNRLVLRRGGRTVTADLQDGVWESADCALDSEAVKRLLIDLSTVRAVSVRSFGDTVGPRVATLMLYSDRSDAPAVLEFGDAVPDVDGRAARRGDLDITFVVPGRPAEALLQLCR
jgi:hypothetical protein